MEGSRPRIVTVRLTSEAASVHADVHLQALARDSHGSAEAARTPVGPYRAAAQATLAALQQLLGDEVRLDLETIERAPLGDDERITVTVAVVTQTGVEVLVGAARVAGDPTSAPVRATLDALNRRFSLLVRDRTEAVQTTPANPANPAISPDRISGIASHQLRSPLATMLTGLQTALDRWDQLDDDARRELVTRAVAQGQRMTRRLDNLLALGTAEDGTPPASPQPMNVRRAVDEAVDEVFDTEDGVTVDVPDDLDVLADPDHFHQILTNWLDNAQRHGAEPISVTADLAVSRVELTVSDRGEGIPTGRLEKIFAGPNGGSHGGSRRSHGLGLYITRLLAEANGGTVHYAPNTPSGTLLTLRLPRP